MHPEIHLNWLAIVAAVIANFVLGAVWYGPLFGKAWARLMNFPPDFKPTQGQMMKGMALAALGSFLVALVLAHGVEVWRASSWGLKPDMESWKYGFFGGFWSWLGFSVPILFGSVAWEGKSWKLFAINAAYWFLSLQIVGAILAHWR